MDLNTGPAPVYYAADGSVNSVLALVKVDKYYCPTNTYLPEWQTSNTIYYNRNLHMYEGWLELVPVPKPIFTDEEIKNYKEPEITWFKKKQPVYWVEKKGLVAQLLNFKKSYEFCNPDIWGEARGAQPILDALDKLSVKDGYIKLGRLTSLLDSFYIDTIGRTKDNKNHVLYHLKRYVKRWRVVL